MPPRSSPSADPANHVVRVAAVLVITMSGVILTPVWRADAGSDARSAEALVVTSSPASWERAEGAADFVGSLATGSAVSPDGSLIIVGSTDVASRFRRERGAAWVTEDASVWHPSTVLGPAESQIRAVAADDEVAVAIGWDHQVLGSLIWSSTDGRSWSTPVSIEGALIFDVTSHQGRFYAAGARVEPPYEAFPTVWSSDGGSAWIATELPGRGVPERIAVRGDGTIMAAGRATMEGIASPGFWVEQGDGWTVLLGPADHREAKPHIFDLLGTPEAFVLIISDGGSRDDPRTIHVSGADLEWRATGIADNVRVLGQLQGDVVAMGQGRMCRSQAASVWTCSDLPEMEDLVPQALVEHDGRLVAVTQVLNENTTDIEVWVDRP